MPFAKKFFSSLFPVGFVGFVGVAGFVGVVGSVGVAGSVDSVDSGSNTGPKPNFSFCSTRNSIATSLAAFAFGFFSMATRFALMALNWF